MQSTYSDTDTALPAPLTDEEIEQLLIDDPEVDMQTHSSPASWIGRNLQGSSRWLLFIALSMTLIAGWIR